MKISSIKKSHRIISVLLAITMVIGGTVCEKTSTDVFAAEPSGYALVMDVDDGYSFAEYNPGETCTVVLNGTTISYIKYIEPNADNPDGGYENATITGFSGKNIYLGPGATLVQEGSSDVGVTINDNTATLYVESTSSTNKVEITNNVGDVVINGFCQGNLANNYGDVIINGSHSGNLQNGYDLENGTGATCIINGSNNGSIENNSSLTISASASVTIPAGGIYTNYAKITTSTFDGDQYGDRFQNYGTIHVDNITLAKDMVYDPDKATYEASNTFKTKINIYSASAYGSSIGHVKAQPDTVLSYEGASGGEMSMFYLTVGSTVNKEIYIGSYDDPMTASYIIKDVPDIDWVGDFPSPVFYGTDYDVTNNVSCDSDGAITITYSDMYGDYQSPATSVKPTEVGEHRVVVSVAETDTYRDVDEYGLKDYWIRYLTDDYDETMGASLEADLINDGGYYYTNKPYKLVANSGFQVSFYSFSPDEPNSEFADTYTVKKDGYYNGTMAALRRKSDNATSDYYFIDSSAIYLDQKAPEVDAASVVDQDGNTPATAVEDGAEIHASKLEFDIKDVWGSSETIYYTALNSVTVNGESVDVDWDTNSAHVVLSTPKARKTYNIVAKDKVGNVNDFSVTIENLDKAETSVSMPDAYYGAVLPIPTVTTNSDQSTENYEYLYKKKGASDDEYSTVKPTTIGDYTVKVNVPYSYNYTASSAESDFSIGYLPAPEIPYSILGAAGNNGYYKSDVTIVAPDDYTISSSIDESSFGESVAYSSSLKSVYLKRKADGARTNAVEIPSILIDKDAPAFSELAMDQEGVAHTLADGLGVHTTGLGFSVSDANLTSVTVDGEATEIIDGKSEVVLNIDPGAKKTFNVVAEDIAGNVSSVSVTLNGMPADTTEEATDKAEPTLTVTLGDQYYGVDYDPTASTDSNGAEGITFSFRKDVEGSAYEDVKPVEPGDYVVKAILPETDHFQGKEVEKKFSISYLPAPTDAYSLSGTEGKNDYYTTDVELVAKDGYKISNRLNGTYDTSVTYTEGMGYVYLKRNSDNAKTTAIKISQEIKVDKVKPALGTFGKDQDGKVVDLTSSFYADTVTFSIYDEHLDTVYLDDTEITVKDGTASITIDAEGGKKGCTVTATDEAGNVYGLRITMMASWMFTNVVPVGSVQLETGNAYKFGSGHYKVNSDSTLYNGGGSFYVLKSGKFEIVSVD